MSEVKDPRIILFGKTIGLPETCPELAAAEKSGGAAQSCDVVGEDCSIQDPPCSSVSMPEESYCNGDADDQELNKNQSCPQQDDKDKDRTQTLISEELKDSNATPLAVEELKILSADTDAEPVQISKTEEDQTETSNSQEKALKEPDKIIPCPRCNSMDTKFCYFNNYNVNQPRHFCKNCHRYWTAGVTMRNVSVGAVCRKNKNSASQFRHPAVPEGLQNARVDLPNGIHHPVLSPNGTVITFNSDAPPYWGCAVPGPLNVPWVVPPTPSQNHTPPTSGPNSPTLGKHSRDDNPLKPVNPEEACDNERTPVKCLWVPKTLRIDDRGEAAKSSIWATLGIKNERPDSMGGGGRFKAFQSQSKGDEKDQVPETSTVLQANPAAMSRSLRFHESS